MKHEDEDLKIECDEFDQMWPGRFLKSGSLGGKPVTLTIKRVWKRPDGDKVLRVIEFEPTKGIDQHEMKLNKINGTILKHLFGHALRAWKGHRFTVAAAVVEQGQYKGEPTIRVIGSPEMAEDEPDFLVDLKNKFWRPFRHPLQAFRGEPGSESLKRVVDRIRAVDTHDVLDDLRDELRAKKWSKYERGELAKAFQRREADLDSESS